MVEISKACRFKCTFLQDFIRKSIDNSNTPERIASLINAVASIGEDVLDDEFGEFDDKSTLRSQPKSTLQSAYSTDKE